MSITLQRQKIRIAADAASFDSPVDAVTRCKPRWWRGGDLEFDIGVFFNGTVVDVANLASITLEVRAMGAKGAVPVETDTPLIGKTVTSFDGTLDADSWADGSKQHAVIALTAAESNIAAGAAWLSIFAITNDNPGRIITLCAGPVQVMEDGSGLAMEPQPVDEVFYTAQQSDARYIAKLTNIDTLTGDGDSALDGIATADGAVTPGDIIEIEVLSGQISFYKYKAGTNTENSPYVILPDDYDADTNAGYWQLLTIGGAIAPSDDAPAVDGVAAAGTSLLYSRADHVHPTDTSRAAVTHASQHGVGGSDPVTLAQSQVTGLTAALALLAPLASPALTGAPTAPTVSTATDNTTKLATTAFVQAAIGAASISESQVTGLIADLALKAPLASPTLTGTPAAPTPSGNDNSTKIATTAYVDRAIGNLVNGAPGLLDTLEEIADALGDDPNFAATMTAQVALKAPLASPSLTGTPTAPTAAVDTNTMQLATTAFVLAQASASGDGNPAMDGAATLGTSTHFARADHVHPTDTSRLAVASNLSDLNNAATARTNLGLGNVENTALSTWAGSTNLTTLGAINSLTAAAAHNLTLNAGSGNQSVVLTPSGTGAVLMPTGTSLNIGTNWNSFLLVGSSSLTGGGLGLGYDGTTASVLSLAPGVAWKAMGFGASSYSFYLSGYAPSLAKVIFNSSGITVNAANIAAVSTDGLILSNPSTATSGTSSQWSPRLRLTGSAFYSSASHTEDWVLENQPGASSGGAQLVLNSYVDGSVVSDKNIIFNASGLMVSQRTTYGANVQMGFGNSISLNNGTLTCAKNSPGAVSSDQIIISSQNSGASSGTPIQYSGRLRFGGSAWTGSASQNSDFYIENQPINGTTPITSKLVFSAQINGGGYANVLTLSNAGILAATTLNLTNALGIAYGGTGSGTKAAAFDALSPMSAAGDLIIGGASGTGTRLAKDADGKVLTLVSGLPAWATPSGGGSGWDLTNYVGHGKITSDDGTAPLTLQIRDGGTDADPVLRLNGDLYYGVISGSSLTFYGNPSGQATYNLDGMGVDNGDGGSVSVSPDGIYFDANPAWKFLGVDGEGKPHVSIGGTEYVLQTV